VPSDDEVERVQVCRYRACPNVGAQPRPAAGRSQPGRSLRSGGVDSFRLIGAGYAGRRLSPLARALAGPTGLGSPLDPMPDWRSRAIATHHHPTTAEVGHVRARPFRLSWSLGVVIARANVRGHRAAQAGVSALRASTVTYGPHMTHANTACKTKKEAPRK